MGEYVDILGVKVSAINLELAGYFVDTWIKERREKYVCVAPVATIVDCQSDAEYMKIVNGAGMVTPDGMPVVWIGRMKGARQISRTYGPDLLFKICKDGLQKKYRHYFYGGTGETSELLVKKLNAEFSGIRIAGNYAPPLRPSGELEDKNILEKINDAGADIIWVGLGSPKQDYWMYLHRDKLNAPVMIGVGAAFDFIAGTKRQAPRWMRGAGLEWVFRLCSEPKRLWKRYLLGNTKFIYFLLKSFLKKTEPAFNGASLKKNSK